MRSLIFTRAWIPAAPIPARKSSRCPAPLKCQILNLKHMNACMTSKWWSVYSHFGTRSHLEHWYRFGKWVHSAGYNYKKHTDWIWVLPQIPCFTEEQKLSVTNLELRKFHLLADVKNISQDREWKWDLAQTEGKALELWRLSVPWGCENNTFLTSHTCAIEKWTCRKGLFQELSETSLLSLQSFCANFLMFCFIQFYTPGVLFWVLASNKAKLIVNHCILTFHVETVSYTESFKSQSAQDW